MTLPTAAAAHQPHAPAAPPSPAPAHPNSRPSSAPAAPAAPPPPLAQPVQQPFAPAVGTRIQVLWRIDYEPHQADQMHLDPAAAAADATADATADPATDHADDDHHAADDHDDAPHTLTKWWGATVQDCLTDTVGSRCAQHADKRLYVLLYDAFHEFGEDTATVAFTAPDCLIDLSQLHDANGGRLQWRAERAPHAAAAAAAAAHAPKPLSLQQYAAEVAAAVRGAGLSEEADLHVLSTLPPHVQARVASGYRRFADHVKNSLATFMQEKPKDYVVTEADVQRLFGAVRSRPA